VKRRVLLRRSRALAALLAVLAGLWVGAAASDDAAPPLDDVPQVPVDIGDSTTPTEPATTTADPGTTNAPSATTDKGTNDDAGLQSRVQTAGDVVAQATPPVGPGSIKVTKETVPTFGAGSFTFTLAWSGATCGTGPGSTQVTLTTPPSGATHTFTNLQTTGCTWTLTETVPAGWTVSVNCSGGASNTDANPSTIVLGNGPPPSQLAADCTFTNTASPSITVTKQTENDFPGSFTFTLSGGQGAGTSPPLSDGQSYTFTGLAFNTAYTVVENVPTGWMLAAADIVCTGGNPNGGTAATNGRTLTLNSGSPASRNNAQCTFTNRTRSIRVTKQTNPDGSSQTFALQLRDSGGNPIGSPQTVSDGQTATWIGLAQGTFQVTEAVPGGWDLSTAPCSGASANSAITNGRSITLGDTTNNDAVCTFTNTKRGQILVTKDTDPDGNSGTFPVMLTGPNAFSETGNLVDDGGQHTFLAPPGNPYSLTENLSGLPYTLDSITCSRGVTPLNPASFTVQADDSIACTVTNDANPGTVTVTKDTDPEGGTGPFPVTLSGPNAYSQTKPLAGDGSSDTFTNVPADNPYNLTENLTVPPYTLDSIACTRGATTLNAASFRVLPGDSIQCTVNNDAKPGRVVVTKDTDPEGNSGTFPVTLNGPDSFSESANLVNDGGQHTFDPVPANSGYSLSEDLTGLPYDLASIVCNGTDVTQSTFSVGPEETVNCTVTNDADPGTVTVTKDTDPEGGTGPFPVKLAGPNSYSQTKPLAGDGSSDIFTDVPADTPYNLTEDLTGLPYTLDSITCTRGETVLNPANFRVLPGDSILCDVNNDAKPGKVVVTKDTDPEGGTGSFPVKLTGPDAYSANGTLADDGGQHTFTPVPAGTGYELSEDLTGLPYGLGSIVCNRTDVTQGTFNVGPDETVSCTVTNVRDSEPNPPAPDSGGSGTTGSVGGAAARRPGAPRLVANPALAFTGSELIWPLAIAALVLLAMGIGLLIVARRPRRA
jgi:Domain of unknown function (DUF5979)